jgi:hypothetical protein
VPRALSPDIHVHQLDAALDGRLIGWRHRIVGQSITTGTALAAVRSATACGGDPDSHHDPATVELQWMSEWVKERIDLVLPATEKMTLVLEGGGDEVRLTRGAWTPPS